MINSLDRYDVPIIVKNSGMDPNYCGSCSILDLDYIGLEEGIKRCYESFVNGCFDVLHRGHFQLIQYAASLGQLDVALDTDEKVSRDKGPRPIYPLEDRVYQMCCLRGVTLYILSILEKN